MEALISVIVPVYNAARYLTDCVKSVQAQTYSNWELLLVDDGSTDGSAELCDKLDAGDSRIRVVHKENAGVSAARNDGIDRAKGEYIAFVDADDLVHPQYLELLLEGINRTGAEISICSFASFPDGAAVPAFSLIETAEFQPVERKTLLSYLLEPSSMESQCMVIPCVKLCRRSCYDGVHFPEGVRHEDEFLVHHLLDGCSFAVVSTVPLYFYRRHEGSFMGAGEHDRDFRHLVFFEALTDRIAYLAQLEPTLVSDTAHLLLRESSEYYAEYTRHPEPIYREKRRWLYQIYQRCYFRYFKLLRNTERVKGTIFLIWPMQYYRMAQWRWKHRNE